MDSNPARQALFAKLVQSRVSMRLVHRAHGWVAGTWLSALMVSSYGLGAFLGLGPARKPRASVLTLAVHANARRHVARVASWVGSADVDAVRTGAGALLHPASLVALATLVRRGGQLRRAIRVVRRIDACHGLLVSCRSAGAIGWYARSKAILARHRPGAVLVSSDSQPEEMAFVAAARSAGVPQVFVSHAYPTPLSPALDFTLSILEGEAAVSARARKGPIRGAVVLAGVEGESAPLDATRVWRPNPVIGVFTPKAVSWPTLAAIVDDCRRRFSARQVIVRWHPSMLQPTRLDRLLEDLSGVAESPRAAPLPEVARQCDWVVADQNSNVHLPVLKLGIPTVAVAGLGVYPPTHADQYGFVAGGVVFPPVSSLRELDVDALAAFFGDCWASRFARYDAAYLQDSEIVGREVRLAVRRLFEDAPEAAIR